MTVGLNKTLHPVPKKSDIEIIPGSIKKISRLEWTFKWKRSHSINIQKVRVGTHSNNDFNFEWV
mgnify:CR=1 FL=1